MLRKITQAAEAKETERARIHDDLAANDYPNKFATMSAGVGDILSRIYLPA